MVNNQINHRAFSQMRQELEQFDKAREKIISIARTVLKLSKAAIYALHRNDAVTAQSNLVSARDNIVQMEALIKQHNHLATTGCYEEALEEYVEASLYNGYLQDGKVKTAKEIGVDADTYLPGLCDFIGELVRRAINDAIKGDTASALTIKTAVTGIYEELMLFDFRNSPLRRKFDGIKYSLEKLEDLALKLTLRESNN